MRKTCLTLEVELGVVGLVLLDGFFWVPPDVGVVSTAGALVAPEVVVSTGAWVGTAACVRFGVFVVGVGVVLTGAGLTSAARDNASAAARASERRGARGRRPPSRAGGAREREAGAPRHR